MLDIYQRDFTGWKSRIKGYFQDRLCFSTRWIIRVLTRHIHMWIFNLQTHWHRAHIHTELYFEPLVTTSLPVAFIRRKLQLTQSQHFGGICSESPVFIVTLTVYLPPNPSHLHSHCSLFPKCTCNLSITLQAVNHRLIIVKEEEQKITQLRFKGSRDEDDSKQQQQGSALLRFKGSLENTLRHCRVYTCVMLKLGKTKHLYSH